MPTHRLDASVDRCSGTTFGGRYREHPTVYYSGDQCPACQVIEQAEQIETLQNRVFDTEDERDRALNRIDQLTARRADGARDTSAEKPTWLGLME